MGLLTLGSPLSWQETKPLVEHVKEHGITQFINLYTRLKHKDHDQLKWGDEIEYVILKLDHANKKVRCALRGDELINRLMALEKLNKEIGTENTSLWRPEYASYMIEGTPGVPYGGLIACFNLVEMNMQKRRLEASSLLKKDEIIMSIGNFMRMGCPDFTSPPTVLTPNDDASVAKSLFFPDKVITQSHIRFSNLTRNIRHRRGENVAINVPIYKDKNTPEPFVEDLSVYGDDGSGQRAAKPDHIYMDAMGFGMGCCCLQVTFQAVNVKEARWLYDQLTPITPIALALSAATPVFRGYLADVDSRWDVIAASVDDRTKEERGLEPLKENKYRIDKSRYDTTDCYLYACSEGYNDIGLQYDQAHYDQLLAGGVDPLLAKHVAHMFIRDPLQVYKERVDQDDQASTEHFETIQSSNWMNMRFKPPPPDSPEIGWRVEFRPTEVQLTDFENAAYVTFVVLLTRVIISFRLTFLVPMSKVNENMQRAQQRDAVTKQKFFFRMGLMTCNNPPMAKSAGEPCKSAPADTIVEMSIDEIVNGKGTEFPGLVPLIKQYLDSADVDVDTRCTVSQYLKFISKRASGEIYTTAHWMREFIEQHADYKHDSRVTDEITYDLIQKMHAISAGEAHCPKLLGDFKTQTGATQIPAALRKAELDVAVRNMQRLQKHTN